MGLYGGFGIVHQKIKYTTTLYKYYKYLIINKMNKNNTNHKLVLFYFCKQVFAFVNFVFRFTKFIIRFTGVNVLERRESRSDSFLQIDEIFDNFTFGYTRFKHYVKNIIHYHHGSFHSGFL